METAMMLARIMGPVYLVLALSMLFYGKAWHSVVEKWTKDHYSMISLMFTYLVLGLIIVNVYNVWAWNVWVLVTLTGWALLVKSVLYFMLPGSVLTRLMKARTNSGVLCLGGIASLLLGLVLTWSAYMA